MESLVRLWSSVATQLTTDRVTTEHRPASLTNQTLFS
jgi:hypothetical protein